MRVFAIDPGPTQSAWIILDNGKILDFAIVQNEALIELLSRTFGMPRTFGTDLFAIEQIRSYGMTVGAEVFETCEWCGRFDQQIRISHGKKAVFVPRQDVKLHLCHSPRANDKNIRQALIDRLGPPGTKKIPGPTYGIKSHIWAALGVAITAADKYEDNDNATHR